MIEVTDDMREIMQKYSEGFVSEDAAAKRIIELHEENKPKQEPIAWMAVLDDGSIAKLCRNETVAACWGLPYQPLYTTKQTREPLSEARINYLIDIMETSCGERIVDFARAIEQAHGIGVKNEH